jgi:hypothetical protein
MRCSERKINDQKLCFPATLQAAVHVKPRSAAIAAGIGTYSPSASTVLNAQRHAFP